MLGIRLRRFLEEHPDSKNRLIYFKTTENHYFELFYLQYCLLQGINMTGCRVIYASYPVHGRFVNLTTVL